MTKHNKTTLVLTVLALMFSVFMIGCSSEMTTDHMNNTRGNQSGFKWDYEITVNVNGKNVPLETTVNVGDNVKLTYVLKNISGTFPQVTVWQDGKEVVKKTNVGQGKTLSYTYTVNTKVAKENATSVIEFIDRADNKNQRFVFGNQPTVSIDIVDEVESFNLTQIEANINKFFEEAQKWFDEMVVKTGESRIFNHPTEGVINIHDLTLRLNATFGHNYGQTIGHILCNDIEGNFYHLVVHPGYTGYSKNAIQIEYTQYNPRLELTKAYIYELGAVCATISCALIVNETSEICEDCKVPAPVYYPVQLITSSKFAGATVGIHPLTTRPHTNGATNGTFSGNVNGFNLTVRVGDVLDRDFWDAVYAAYAISNATFSSDVTPDNVTLWWTSNGFGWEGNSPAVTVTEAMLGANKTVLYLNPLLDIIKITRPIIDSELIDWARLAQKWYSEQEGITQLTNEHIATIITYINNDPNFDRGHRLGFNDKGRWSFRLSGSSLASRQLTMVIFFENPINSILPLQGMACFVDLSSDDERIFIAEPRFNSAHLPW